MCGCGVLAMLGVAYVASSAAPSHVAGDAVACDYRGTPRDPSRTKGLVLESVPELLSQLALRVAALKTLEGALLSLMLSERIATRGLNNASRLLPARELAELFGVPESV